MSTSSPPSSEHDPSVERIQQRVPAHDTEEAGPELTDNDDDMDFEQTTEGTEDDWLIDELEDAVFHDAEENLSGVEIEFEISGTDDQETEDTEENDDGEETETEEPRPAAANATPVYITREQMMQLLSRRGLGRMFGMQWAQDDDDDYSRTRRRGPRGKQTFEKVPSDKGRELMASGTFGTPERPEDTIKRKKKLAYRLMRRELALGSPGRQRSENRLALQNLIPSSTADMIIHYNARCYSGQFSADGNFFFSCAQDFKVRMYDTSNPYDWKYYKSVHYPYGGWTITDASLSPDNKYLAYSSITNRVCLAATDPEDDSQPYLLDFADTGTEGAGSRWGRHRANFGIWSIRFSGDGREIVAGTNGRSIYVYDIERRQSVLRIAGHDDDVNAVCYGDAHSPHVLYSGSDDTTVKVWDRRSLGDGRPAGVFIGHTEGLTYVDSKGDGRYVLSNAKDQTAKLWDLRKTTSTEEAERIDPQRYTTNFEYRQEGGFNFDNYQPHPRDCSLVTFRGHAVLKTLIRCHFSPPGSTDSRYVYSGSHDGSVYIWNLDATLAGKVNVLEATRNSRPRDPDVLAETYDFFGRNGGAWQTCVRDASWHPNAPVIAATSWNGWGTSLGTCTVHSWNDGLEADEAEPKMGRRVNAQLQHDDELYNPRGGRNYRTRARRRAGFDDDDDD